MKLSYYQFRFYWASQLGGENSLFICQESSVPAAAHACTTLSAAGRQADVISSMCKWAESCPKTWAIALQVAKCKSGRFPKQWKRLQYGQLHRSSLLFLFVCLFFYTFSTQCLVHWLVNVSLHTHVTDHPEATTRNFHFIVHHWFWRSLWTKDEKDETTRIKSSVSLQASRLLGSPSALHNKTMFWLYYLSSPEKLEFSPMTGIKNNYNHLRNILLICLCSSHRGISVEAVP